MAAGAAEIIDAHVHVWERARFPYSWINADSSLNRDFGPDNLAALLAAHPVTGGVLVEAANTPDEIDWLCACARALPGNWGVVGWLALDAPNAPDRIAEGASEPAFKGVRLHWESPSFDGSRLQNGIAALARHRLTLDVLGAFDCLPRILDFARRHPEVPLILNHFAGAQTARAGFNAIAEAIEPFSSLHHVAVKMSGFLSGPVPCDLPCLRTMLVLFDGVFGPERMLFGSDYPISTVTHPYASVLKLALEASADRDPRWRSSLFAQTARTLYRLHAPLRMENPPK